jgi:hypothetical protein
METKKIGNDPIPQENSSSGESVTLETVRMLAAEAGINITDDQASKILRETEEKKRIIESMKNETGQAPEFLEHDFIKTGISQIKKAAEFKASYMAALSIFQEICPNGTFFKFNMEDPLESLIYTQRMQGKEEGRLFFATIAHRLKSIKEVLGAPVERGTRCFMIIAPDHIKEYAISKIDKNGRLTMIGFKGNYNQDIFKNADDAIKYLKEKYADKLKGKEVKVESVEDKE